jgi:hypothetical protein
VSRPRRRRRGDCAGPVHRPGPAAWSAMKRPPPNRASAPHEPSQPATASFTGICAGRITVGPGWSNIDIAYTSVVIAHTSFALLWAARA